jgi:hypothetical protein
MTNQEARCQEKAALLAAYEKATRAYSEAVRKLREITGVSQKADYDTQYRMAEAFRIDARAAREALERHVAAHHC